MDTLVSVGSRVQGVAQQLVDTHLADVRPEVLKGLDARHMTAKETSITILGMGARCGRRWGLGAAAAVAVAGGASPQRQRQRHAAAS